VHVLLTATYTRRLVAPMLQNLEDKLKQYKAKSGSRCQNITKHSSWLVHKPLHYPERSSDLYVTEVQECRCSKNDSKIL